MSGNRRLAGGGDAAPAPGSSVGAGPGAARVKRIGRARAAGTLVRPALGPGCPKPAASRSAGGLKAMDHPPVSVGAVL